MSEPQVVDLLHLGRSRVIGCWRVGEVLIDPGPSSCLPTLLAALGDWQPRALLLTHIHLDHAGASGSLARRWPEVEVYVHERGAPHMVDPARLIASATQLYGADMDRLWGEFLPVPEDRLRILSGGESLLDGEFEVAYTPGHASHHVSYLRDGVAFVGDTGGVQIIPGAPVIPPTPPPDIDVEKWHASLELIRAWRPSRLAMTHFGDETNVEAHLTELGRRLDEFAERVRAQGIDEFIAGVAAVVAAGLPADDSDELAAAYVQAAPPEQLYAGLQRYWRKRSERAGTAVS